VAVTPSGAFPAPGVVDRRRLRVRVEPPPDVPDGEPPRSIPEDEGSHAARRPGCDRITSNDLSTTRLRYSLSASPTSAMRSLNHRASPSDNLNWNCLCTIPAVYTNVPDPVYRGPFVYGLYTVPQNIRADAPIHCAGWLGTPRVKSAGVGWGGLEALRGRGLVSVPAGVCPGQRGGWPCASHTVGTGNGWPCVGWVGS
jgi:hypothetical protein